MELAQHTVDRSWLRRLLRDKFVWLGLAVWAIFAAAIPFLAHGSIPFDQPWLAPMRYSMRVAIWITGPVFALTIIGVTFALTHHRTVEISVRAPERAIALRETVGLFIYGGLVLVAGLFLGKMTGKHRIGLHLAGSMFGLADAVTPGEAYTWSAYNFVFYAALPYWFFRRRGYSNEALCLKSSDIRNDVLVIVAILAMGLSGDLLPGNRIWSLTKPSSDYGWRSAGIHSVAVWYRPSHHDFSDSDPSAALQEADKFNGGDRRPERIHLRIIAFDRVLDAL